MSSTVRLVAAALTCAVTFVAGAAWGDEPGFGWTQAMRGPQPSVAPDVRDQELLQACGQGDSALHAVATQVAMNGLASSITPDSAHLSEMVRRAGDPHVGARVWLLSGSVIDRADALVRLNAWLAKHQGRASRRCGIGSASDSQGKETLAVVAVDARADLVEPVAIRLRQGMWVTLTSRMLAPTDAVTVAVLRPRGLPYTVPSNYDPRTRRLVARFMVDMPGRWTAQVLGTDASGPLPVLETVSFCGVDPDSQTANLAVAGEGAATGLAGDSEGVTAMLNAARQQEGQNPLLRDARLDSLALAHATRMMQAGRISHDAGDGDPLSRLSDAGIDALEAGENVAHAATITAAHRVLWWSPSHRKNMLHDRYTNVGVGVVRDSSGQAWITELFAAF